MKSCASGLTAFGCAALSRGLRGVAVVLCCSVLQSLAAAEAVASTDGDVPARAAAPASASNAPAHVLAWHMGWAELCEAAHRWNDAEVHRAAALAWWTEQRGEANWRTNDARAALENTRWLNDLTPQQQESLRQCIDGRREARRIFSTRDYLDEEETAAALRKIRSTRFVFGASFGNKHPFMLACLEDEIDYLTNAGDLAAVADRLRTLLRIRKEMLGAIHPGHLANLRSLAKLSPVAQADSLLEEALECRRQLYGKDSTEFAAGLDDLAAVDIQNNDLTSAEARHREALEIRLRVIGKQHPDYATSLFSLAGVYRRRHLVDRAQAMCEDALSIRQAASRGDDLEYAANLLEAATLYGQLRDYEKAIPLYEQAAAIRQKLLGDKDLSYAETLDGLADMYMSAGQYDQAAALYAKVATHVAGYTRQHHLAMAKLGFAQMHLGRMQQAAFAADIARGELFRTDPGSGANELPLATLHMAGLYAQTQGRWLDACIVYQKAIRHGTMGNDHAALHQTEQEQLAFSRRDQFLIDGYMSALLRDANFASHAYPDELRWKGSIFMRLRAARRAAASEELRPLFAKLQPIASRWSAMSRHSRGGEQLDAIRRKKESLEKELSEKSADFRELAGENLFDELLAALSQQTALVDFVQFQRCEVPGPGGGPFKWHPWLMAFVIRAGQPPQVFDLGDYASVATAIDVWRSSYGESPASQAAAALLRERLWKRIEAALGGADTVLISPDGALGQFPFAALPGRAPDSFLLEDYRLALAPVPRLIPALVNAGDSKPLEKALLLVGNVDYNRGHQFNVQPNAAAPADDGDVVAQHGQTHDTAAGLVWKRLPGAAAEVRAIELLYDQFDGAPPDAIARLYRDRATESQFRTIAPKCSILHLATHGFFAAEDKPSALSANSHDRGSMGSLFGERLDEVSGYSPGLLSGIVLAGANHPPELSIETLATGEAPDDGILTADELMYLPLGGVELVVLSACETGLGQSAGGEGLLGIQRAFQIAGARSTIASLWTVDDAMTKRLMTMFYTNVLEKKQSYLDALRNAQIDLVRQLRQGGAAALAEARGAEPPPDAPPSASPYYWAAFTFSGDWR